MLDTGALRTFLSLRFAMQQLKGVPKDDYHTGTFRGQSGIGETDQRTSYAFSRAQSTITLSELPPVSLPTETYGESFLDRQTSPDFEFEIGMLFGVSSFTYAQRVTFDYPHKIMTFEYANPDAAPDTSKSKK